MTEEKDVPRQAGGEEEKTGGEGGTGGGEKRGWPWRLPPEFPVFLFFFLVTLFLTWPLIIRFTSSIYGFPSDNLGNIWVWWWFRKAASFGASRSFCPLVGFPFGMRVGFVFVEPVADLFERFLLLFLNETVVYNLSTIASFLLSGITMYYLVRHLTDDRKAAFFGGFAYLVCAYHSFNSLIFPHLAITQWMPLYILTLLWFMKKPTWKHAAFLCLSGILVAGTCIHYGFFMIVFTAAFLPGRLAFKRVQLRRQRKRDGLSGRIPLGINRNTLAISLLVLLVVVVMIVPYTTIALSKMGNPGKWQTRPIPGNLRTEQYFVANSAHPLDYFLPPVNNPVLGTITQKILPGSNTYRSSNYISWTAIILALLAIFIAFRPGRKKKAPPANLKTDDNQNVEKTQGSKRFSNESRGIICGLIFAAAVAYVLSLRPFVNLGSTKIPTPSALFAALLPWYRWYMRMGIVVIICFILLACFGLAQLLKKGTKSLRVLILILVVLIIFIEMIIVPPYENISFKRIPPIFEKIATLPRGSAVAFYPMLSYEYNLSSYLISYQRWFLKPTINHAFDNTDAEAVRRTIYSLSNEDTPKILRRFGINYVVYFEQAVSNAERLKITETMPGLRQVALFKGQAPFGNARLFQITAPKAVLVPLYLGDITVPVIENERVFRLMEHDGILRILNYGKGGIHVKLQLPVINMDGKHQLVITSEGRLILRGDLDGDQGFSAEISDLVVPPEDLELRILVKGDEKRLTANQFNMFGTTGATLMLGDVQLTPL